MRLLLLLHFVEVAYNCVAVLLLISFGRLRRFLSVIDVGEISRTGRRSNRKKPFKITFLNRIPVPCTFVHT
jgi:hypothetical protein